MGEVLGFVGVTGPDRHLDTTGYFDDPINGLVMKCASCTFPDLDAVPQPYILGRGIDRPVDMAPTTLANFLVREWPRKVLEATCPGQCEFHTTIDKKSKQTAPWFLAVPVQRISIGRIRAEVPRCPACGEPKTCHANEFDSDFPRVMDWDLAKSHSWFSHNYTIGLERDRAHLRSTYGARAEKNAADVGWARQRIYRNLYFSLRLELLLKKLNIKGMTRLAGDQGVPTSTDKVWVDEQMTRLNQLGLAPRPVQVAPEGHGWLDAYLEKHRKRRLRRHDFTMVEARLGVSLPLSYKAFVEQIGTTTFKNIEGEEGFEARILPPQELDTTTYRQGAVELGDEESRQIDGVLFAATGHGDGFCFDLAGIGPEYPVYLYDHELNAFEAYAPNFEGFVRRIAGNDG